MSGHKPCFFFGMILIPGWLDTLDGWKCIAKVRLAESYVAIPELLAISERSPF